MRGHAGANLMPLIASNRIGREAMGDRDVTFYGSSFIADGTGALLAKASRHDEEVITAAIDMNQQADMRSSWGLFRDRRVDLFGRLNSL